MQDEPKPPPKNLIELEESGETDGARRLLFQVNFNVFSHPIQNELQAILDSTRLAYLGIEKVEAMPERIEGQNIQVQPANNKRLPISELRMKTRHRLLRSALQDALETSSIALEQARELLAHWKLQGFCKAADYVRVVEKQRDQFHKLPLGRKLEHLDTVYDFQVPVHVTEVLYALQRVRNCVVHRLGLVTEIDTEGAAGLTAVWEQHALMAGTEQPTRPVKGGDVVVGGESVWVVRQKAVRHFPLGSYVELDLSDLNEICRTIHLLSNHIRDALRTRFAAMPLDESHTTATGTADRPSTFPP